MSRLFIAEKPSMAGEIAKVLGNPVKRNGYIDTQGGKVTWGYGHILQQADPAHYDPKYKAWNMSDLPIIPKEWKLLVSSSCKDQFKIVKDLINEASEIVHAGDPDREGQLLIDEVLDYVKNIKPVLRIILNALDEKSIKRALGSLKNNADYFNLKQSALARSRADWLMGMNLSRAYTIAAQRAGHEGTMAIGRVKTPTLALVVRREEEIKNFKSIDYFTLKVSFKHQNGVFTSYWEPSETNPGLDSEGRLINKSVADDLVKRMRNELSKAIIENCVKEQKITPQRLPYSLSSLQIDAGKKFGYSPQLVLETVQKLYERKLTSYPRSDCDYLPESQIEDASVIIANFKDQQDSELSQWADNADLSIKSRAWNDKKITAHHAIIPTTVKCEVHKLSAVERDIYLLIAKAFTAQFYAAHVYNHTKIAVKWLDELFTASGNEIVTDGWRSLYRKDEEEKKDDIDIDNESLPKVMTGDQLDYLAGYVNEKKTKPPSRFTSSTLLQAMKEIHKYVKNAELKKQLKDVSGIGTEATRATIIDEIIERGFLREEKKFLVPTDKAYLIVSLLPDELTYPDATAEWEMTFEQMCNGKVKLDDFILKQQDFIRFLCDKANQMEIKQADGITCPTCDKGVLKSRKGKNGSFWGCNRYPDCKATYPDKKGAPDLEPPIGCPECNIGVLRKHKGAHGEFWSCSNYTNCKASFENKRGKPVIIKCPACNTGTLRKKQGSKGAFWGCSKHPKCSATFNDDNGKPQFKKQY